MSLQWTDVEDIALALEERCPDVDILAVRFTDLWKWVQEIPSFKDRPERSNERILQAIQAAWLEERKDGVANHRTK